MAIAPEQIPVLFLAGPTASGKTGLSLQLAEALAAPGSGFAGAEIVSVDSAQIYRGMDIGTAKPSLAERRGVPHHLIDILDPAASYSAARFRDDALVAIAAIRARCRVPLLVGGTGLYFNALEHGLSELPAASPALRAQIEADAGRLGWPAQHARLAAIDPESAGRIKPNDRQRLLRALEIHAVTGRTRSELWQAARSAPLATPLVKLALAPDSREALHTAIAQRFRQMMAAGFLDEVRALRARGDLQPELPAIRAVGYRQLWEHLDGRDGLESAIERGIAATRQYAKRQLTWQRGQSGYQTVAARAPDTLAVAMERLRAAAGQ